MVTRNILKATGEKQVRRSPEEKNGGGRRLVGSDTAGPRRPSRGGTVGLRRPPRQKVLSKNDVSTYMRAQRNRFCKREWNKDIVKHTKEEELHQRRYDLVTERPSCRGEMAGGTVALHEGVKNAGVGARAGVRQFEKCKRL